MNPEVTRNKAEEGCGRCCVGYEMNTLHASSRDCSEPAGPSLRFLWLALAHTLRILALQENDARELMDHNTAWAGSMSVCIAPDAEACTEQQNGEEKKHPCPCGLWTLPCALSGFSSLPQGTALWLLSVFDFRHKYDSWFPKTGPGRTKIHPVPPCTLVKTGVLNKFCGGVQSLLERNENLASTSGGFGSRPYMSFLTPSAVSGIFARDSLGIVWLHCDQDWVQVEHTQGEWTVFSKNFNSLSRLHSNAKWCKATQTTTYPRNRDENSKHMQFYWMLSRLPSS